MLSFWGNQGTNQNKKLRNDPFLNNKIGLSNIGTNAKLAIMILKSSIYEPLEPILQEDTIYYVFMNIKRKVLKPIYFTGIFFVKAELPINFHRVEF